MRRPAFALGAVLVLAFVWVWPLPFLGLPPFSSHMVAHMGVVALASPLFAIGIAGGSLDPVTRAPGLIAAIPASIVELGGVWAWHAPALHDAARTDGLAYALEQGTFLVAGLFLWTAALGGSAELRRSRVIAGVAGLFLTSMHMTLLGALLALGPRLVYAHAHSATGFDPLLDQQLGGAVMLIFGGVVYLVGGLGLSADALLRSEGALDVGEKEP